LLSYLPCPAVDGGNAGGGVAAGVEANPEGKLTAEAADSFEVFKDEVGHITWT
jgi:hypothetical protein